MPKLSIIFTAANVAAFLIAILAISRGHQFFEHIAWFVPLITFLVLLYFEAKSKCSLGYEDTLKSCLQFSAWSGIFLPIPLFVLLSLPSIGPFNSLQTSTALYIIISLLISMFVCAGLASLLCIVLLNQFWGVLFAKR